MLGVTTRQARRYQDKVRTKRAENRIFCCREVGAWGDRLPLAHRRWGKVDSELLHGDPGTAAAEDDAAGRAAAVLHEAPGMAGWVRPDGRTIHDLLAIPERGG